MAKIIRRHIINTVKQSYFKCNLLLALCTAAGVFCVISAFFSYGISLIIIPFLIFIFLKLKKQKGILASGISGEESCLKLLSQLPSDFYVIPDVTLCVGHKTAQLDYIIIGPTGIFIVEAKNHRGTICGSANSSQLSKTKKLADGKTDSSKIYNPIYQVSTHVKLLTELLFDKKIYTVVSGCVYFSNPNATVEISGSNPDVNIFSKRQNGEKLILECICRSKNSKLSSAQIKRLKKYIFSHCK